jgi:hypothetical protein
VGLSGKAISENGFNGTLGGHLRGIEDAVELRLKGGG